MENDISGGFMLSGVELEGERTWTAFHVKLYDNCSVLFFLNIEELTGLFYQGTVL